VTPFAARPVLHEAGTFVEALTPSMRTSRWRSGPTSFGPVGRILCTTGLAALFPWWGLGGSTFFLWSLMGWLGMAGIVLQSAWKRERVVDPSPTRSERLRARHPFLAQVIRLTGSARVVVLLIAVGCAAAAWFSLDDTAPLPGSGGRDRRGRGDLPGELERPVTR
jgi:hypothetical protein